MRSLELYKYNPGQSTPEEIESTFVARGLILSEIIQDLRGSAEASANQHFLIIGPRGVGKTNLLLMIKRRILIDETLSRFYLPLQTAEEEYSITSLRDFFAKILGLLSEQETGGEVKEAEKAVVKTDDDEEAVEYALSALKRYYNKSQRKILLLLDNIDLILNDQLTKDAEIGKIRDILMNEPFLVIVGTAPTFFREASGYDRPLYNFFKIIHLEELTVEQMIDLLRTRAQWDGNQAFLDRLEEIQPKLRAMHHLTGGNPRLVLMLYQFCTQTELPEVRTSLQMLLDDLTPYYKARLEQLPAQQRKVMDTFARLGRPITPTELASETRLPVNQINSILKRLREHGFVSLAPQKRRKTTLYLVSERVFRIWYQMRFSTLGRRRIEFLIEFIRIWYTVPDWIKEADRLISECRKTATKTGPEQERLFKRAFEKYAAALKVKPDDHEALYNWGAALSDLARTKTGPEQERLFEGACEKINKAVEIAVSLEEKERTAFYAAHYVHVALLRCALAVEREDRGHARRQLDATLNLISRARSELVRTELVNFFRRIATEKTADLCGEFLEAMRKPNLKDEVDALEPFAIAVRYWQEGKNDEVLDRLNPEVRELVAEIIGVPSEAQAD